MGVDAGSHSDGTGQGNGRRPRMFAAGAVTVALATGVLASGGLGYAATGVKKGAGGPTDKQYGDTRPGWGCGDKNHVHTGPPGRQYATPPPGCTKK
jgi:hypothetical protein